MTTPGQLHHIQAFGLVSGSIAYEITTLDGLPSRSATAPLSTRKLYS